MVKVQQLGLHRLGVRWTSSLYPQIRRGACGVRRETDWIFRELVQCTLNLWSPKCRTLIIGKALKETCSSSQCLRLNSVDIRIYLGSWCHID